MNTIFDVVRKYLHRVLFSCLELCYTGFNFSLRHVVLRFLFVIRSRSKSTIGAIDRQSASFGGKGERETERLSNAMMFSDLCDTRAIISGQHVMRTSSSGSRSKIDQVPRQFEPLECTLLHDWSYHHDHLRRRSPSSRRGLGFS